MAADERYQVVVLSSGEGQNFQALLDAAEAGTINARITALAADKKCPAIHRAEAVRLPIIFHPWGYYRAAGKRKETYDRDLAVKILMRGADLVVFDGWTRMLSNAFFDQFPDRAVYLHHSHTGRFPGSNAFEDTYEAYERGDITEAMVQVLLTTGGDIRNDENLLSRKVPIRPDDTLEALQARQQQAGTEALLEVLTDLLEES